MSKIGKVTTGFSMSLDGFIAGPNEDFQYLFAWMAGGDIDYTLTIGKNEQKLKISAESIERFLISAPSHASVRTNLEIYSRFAGSDYTSLMPETRSRSRLAGDADDSISTGLCVKCGTAQATMSSAA